ncbi:hypothetical protein DFH11DRAFT_1547866 [Phellopilus nigrolimitatus]|nr:hypothetical protein DFH11DRAFT_1547866 [Phellopilus nigrolimitatus]
MLDSHDRHGAPARTYAARLRLPRQRSVRTTCPPRARQRRPSSTSTRLRPRMYWSANPSKSSAGQCIYVSKPDERRECDTVAVRCARTPSSSNWTWFRLDIETVRGVKDSEGKVQKVTRFNIYALAAVHATRRRCIYVSPSAERRLRATHHRALDARPKCADTIEMTRASVISDTQSNPVLETARTAGASPLMLRRLPYSIGGRSPRFRAKITKLGRNAEAPIPLWHDFVRLASVALRVRMGKLGGYKELRVCALSPPALFLSPHLDPARGGRLLRVGRPFDCHRAASDAWASLSGIKRGESAG